MPKTNNFRVSVRDGIINVVTPETDKTLTLQQTVERWQCHPLTIHRRIKAGLLTGFKIGVRWRFRLSDILAAEEKMAQKQPPLTAPRGQFTKERAATFRQRLASKRARQKRQKQ